MVLCNRCMIASPYVVKARAITRLDGLCQLQPDVDPQVLHFMQVPFRTKV